MKKYVIPFLICFSIVFSWNAYCAAQVINSNKQVDTKELKINDILMILLGDEMDKAVSNYYAHYLTESPLVYPYMVDINKVERVGEFRTFHFFITLETTPVVGPHISVGKDRMTFEISPIIPGKIRLKEFMHLETHELPPNWQHILKQKPKDENTT